MQRDFLIVFLATIVALAVKPTVMGLFNRTSAAA